MYYTNSFFHSIEENGITLQQESFNFGAAFHFWNENPFERIFIFTDKVFKYLDTRFYNEVEGSNKYNKYLRIFFQSQESRGYKWSRLVRKICL